MKLSLSLHYFQWEIRDFRTGCNFKGGDQPIIWPIFFPKSCMKMKHVYLAPPPWTHQWSLLLMKTNYYGLTDLHKDMQVQIQHFTKKGAQLWRPKVANIAEQGHTSKASYFAAGVQGILQEPCQFLGFQCSNMYSTTFSSKARQKMKNSPIRGCGGLSKMSKMSIIELSRLGQDLFDFSDLTWTHPLTHP